MRRAPAIVASCGIGAAVVVSGGGAAKPPGYLLDDSHVHLTNYIQEGTSIRGMLDVMGDKVGRAVLFGIPLQQMWSSRVDGSDAPRYYLDSDSPLYYYSFTDAQIATAYLSLGKAQRARFDPMITGFNPADMYAADHVRRVLATFPGVFEGIGEFSLHKEFVTPKVATDPPSLDDPAVDRLFALAEEAGLVVLVHCDVDTPFPRAGQPPAYFEPLKALFARHPHATIIWAHIGLGRVVRPVKDQATLIAAMLEDPKLAHVRFDLSWSETAKYIVATPQTVEVVADLITRYPERFLFGTDEVAPVNQSDYLRVYRQYEPLWAKLPARARDLVLKGNFERIFDEARRHVRAWERLHPNEGEPSQPIVRRATGPD
jgi:hypothetical protein